MTKLSKLDAELHDQLDATANSQKRNAQPWVGNTQRSQDLMNARLGTSELLNYFQGRYDNQWRRLHS